MKIIKPHLIDSRVCLESDIKRILKDVKQMELLCKEPIGLYKGGFAIAHPQVTDQDPLRFFATRDARIFINPEIIRHTRTPVDSKEGCMSFAHIPEKIVNRYNKITIKFVEISPDEKSFTEFLIANESGLISKVFQHEIDHFNSKYIFDIDA